MQLFEKRASNMSVAIYEISKDDLQLVVKSNMMEFAEIIPKWNEWLLKRQLQFFLDETYDVKRISVNIGSRSDMYLPIQLKKHEILKITPLNKESISSNIDISARTYMDFNLSVELADISIADISDISESLSTYLDADDLIEMINVKLHEDLEKLRKKWLKNLTCVDQRAFSTIELYDRYTLPYIEYCQKNKLTLSDTFDTQTIYKWFDHYKQENNNKEIPKSTHNLIASCLRSFLKFNNKDVEKITKPEFERKLPEVVSQETVIQRLRELEESIETDRQLTTYLLSLYMYSTGARLSEALNLKPSDLRKDGVYITREKTDSETFVPLPKSVIARLEDYIENSKTHVFKDSKGDRLTRQAAHKSIRKYLKINPHTLRHSCATHMYQNGCDLKIIQELLGHSDIKTTQIYTHVQNLKLLDTVNKHHPINQEPHLAAGTGIMPEPIMADWEEVLAEKPKRVCKYDTDEVRLPKYQAYIKEYRENKLSWATISEILEKKYDIKVERQTLSSIYGEKDKRNIVKDTLASQETQALMLELRTKKASWDHIKKVIYEKYNLNLAVETIIRNYKGPKKGNGEVAMLFKTPKFKSIIKELRDSGLSWKNISQHLKEKYDICASSEHLNKLSKTYIHSEIDDSTKLPEHSELGKTKQLEQKNNIGGK